jgi:hypothetical protein
MSGVQSATQIERPPSIRFFADTSESFVQFGDEWRRLTQEDEARMHTGYDRLSHEPSVGIYIVRRPNGLVRVGFDLWKLNANLRPAVIERLENRWRQESASLSKSMLRSTLRRSHFSRSFARFEVSPERLEGWKQELESILSNPDSYEQIEHRTDRG